MATANTIPFRKSKLLKNLITDSIIKFNSTTNLHCNFHFVYILGFLLVDLTNFESDFDKKINKNKIAC